jgi:hypothetical protein
VVIHPRAARPRKIKVNVEDEPQVEDEPKVEEPMTAGDSCPSPQPE